jgi:hypothetical protein
MIFRWKVVFELEQSLLAGQYQPIFAGQFNDGSCSGMEDEDAGMAGSRECATQQQPCLQRLRGLSYMIAERHREIYSA